MASPASAEKPVRARLVVLVYFDQLRGDYLERWSNEFGDGGFRRLMTDGAWLQNCHYPYSYTVTGPGHASVATGCPPSVHGVVGNDWYDRSERKTVNCVGTDLHSQVPLRTVEAAESDEKKVAKGGVSPERLLKPTVADALKLETGGASKVVALSLKNRGAALAGGKTPDACYWMDGATGQFVTSTYYRNELHDWANEFNAAQVADRWRGKMWQRLRNDLDYEALSGPDDSPGENPGSSGQGRVFPHALESTDPTAKAAYYSAIYSSPFGNELLLDFAERAIIAEKLGADETPDFLSISFSSNDSVGHGWGPDSQEVLDMTLRSDLIMKRLLEVLDENVGRGRYVLAMTADHGVCPLPEVSQRHGQIAERVQPATTATMEQFLAQKYGKMPEKWIEAVSGPWVYLNARAVEAAKIQQSDVEAALAGWLMEQEGVETAYTRTSLTRPRAEFDALQRMVSLSFFPERCGDVYFILKPYHLSSAKTGTGTSHGSPWEYDTYVPLVVYGAGIRAGIHKEKTSPLAAATILCKAAGMKPPAGATTPEPDGVLESVK